MERPIKIFESIVARLKKRPDRTALICALLAGCLTLVWLFSGSGGENGGQIASVEERVEVDARPDPQFFEGGSIAYHRFRLNKTISAPFEVGNCPGGQCYRVFFGPREIRKGRQLQTIFLGGGGIEKHLEKKPDGGVAISRLARFDTTDGRYGISSPERRRSILGWGLTVPYEKGLIEATLYVFKGASLRLRAVDQDVLLVVEDDRINSLTIGVAIYDGTFCTLYKEACVNKGIIS
jgi:hypothetical protein